MHAPVVQDLVLIGGGHTHLAVLKSFGMRPITGLRLTLISRNSDTPYSGMLPGLIAGHYSRDEMHFDLRRLAEFAGGRFMRDEVVGLDLATRHIHCRERPPVRFDILSINTG
ncbi:MAG: selenide, water dikinase SelD, partial [Gammaproteobacteria bacterium]